jgi:hypothetical protein
MIFHYTLARFVVDVLGRIVATVVLITIMIQFLPPNGSGQYFWLLIALGVIFFPQEWYGLDRNIPRLLKFEQYEKDTLSRIAELEGRKPGDKAA